MLFNEVMNIKDALAEQWEKEAKILKSIPAADVYAIKYGESMTIIGQITGLKDKHLCVKVWAASEVDYKMRNLSTKGIKRRTYPVNLIGIREIKGITFEEVPLYVNFKYISPQFKNRFLR